MLKKTKKDYSPMLCIKAAAVRFVAVVIVGSLLCMPGASNAYLASHGLKTDNQEITKTSLWSVATKTIDLYLRPFDESSIKQSYSETSPIFKNLPSAFIKNVAKSDFELPESHSEYLAYSESAAEIIDKTYIFFPFHYFW
jgi:hypothetical protein